MKATMADLRAMTGFNHNRIKNAIQHLPFEKGERNSRRYDTHKALPALYLGHQEHFDVQEERGRLTYHQANLAELDEAVQRGILIQFDEAVKEVENALARFRAKLLNVPSKYATLVAGEDDVQAVKDILENAMLEAAAELRNKFYDGDNEGSDSRVESAAEAEC